MEVGNPMKRLLQHPSVFDEEVTSMLNSSFQIHLEVEMIGLALGWYDITQISRDHIYLVSAPGS